jgi:hypothetical protein
VSVEERFDTRFGKVGLTNSSGQRLFTVTVDDPDNDWPAVDPDLPAFNTGFKNFPGLVVRERDVISKLNNFTYVVSVTYGIPIAFTYMFGQPWQVSFSGSLTTEAARMSVAQSGDRPARLGPGDEWPVPARVIGVPKYERVQTDATHEVTLAGKSVKLKQLAERRSIPSQRTRGVGSVRFFRRFTTSTPNVPAAQSYINRVNSQSLETSIGTFPELVLKMTQLDVQPLPPLQPTPTHTVDHNVTINMAYDERGHTQDEAHTFADDDGNEALVSKIGSGVVTERFYHYERADLRALFRVLA